MTNIEKLIRFMEKKRTALRRTGLKKGSLYFNKKDARALREELNEKAAERIWKRIIQAIEYGEDGLVNSLCPFCHMVCSEYRRGFTVTSRFCHMCSYGKNHGICYDSDSDFKALLRSKHRSEHRMTSEEYRQILKEMEKEGGKE